MDRTAAAPETLRYEEARARVLAAARPLPAEEVHLGSARGRAARRALTAPADLPPFRNSSMDGVALRSADASRALPVTGSIAAGAPADRPLAPGACVWIMTGAPVPDGADAVVPVEALDLLEGAVYGRPGGTVRSREGVKPGANVREAGADVRAGERVWEAGRNLSAQDLGVLAALGYATVAVGCRPRVAVISTGDELIDPGEPARPGAIRDSNRPMLQALLEESGCVVASSERVADDPARVAEAIDRGIETADATITIGGVSAGAFDPVRLGLARFGEIALWRVAMKPGRPQAFGTPRGRLFFGLPGNPASVACVFEALVRPALRAIQGFSDVERHTVSARAERDIESRAGRTDLVRVTLALEDGAWRAREAGAQVSGHVMPQSRAHALLVVPEEVAVLRAGESARAWVLRWPGNA